MNYSWQGIEKVPRRISVIESETFYTFIEYKRKPEKKYVHCIFGTTIMYDTDKTEILTFPFFFFFFWTKLIIKER